MSKLQELENNKRRKLSSAADQEHSQPWVEKYRPRKLDDVAAQDHAVTVLKKTLQSANLPHMLFYGPPGTGKTSTILALTKELFGPSLVKSRVLELNASDERGISIVREKVKNFARLTVSKPSNEDLENYPCPPYKIIILDEADSMTADAQSALRRTMETYSGVTRFCLICNYITRIIDPLASRCSKFRFKSLDASNALSRLSYVADQESVTYEEGSLEKILDISAGDLRKAITLLQSASKLSNYNDNNKITPGQLEELAGIVPTPILKEIVEKVASKDVNSIVQYVSDFCKDGWSGASVINQLHEHYITNDMFDTNFKNQVSMILFDTDSKLTNGTNERIQLLNALIKISQV
ncbi:similar to Saccharomyces cerevisiae YJR068W RFC2 Subunit of heteropentameric Replication factor C (RF-C) [Maudiozyma barnettii]|uniref:Replication factor C subunit 2 n=1 Tax=Maudiozyma barnettii TaxID=61262 RepID=A0A8H2ZHQ0_9SACH|nr:replication factor C subunit 2 [Kazachstania barnettii]CAB4254732.1 similar to Saccharomyces cerevisiae YJR068W RFC2 Subunit of heteropentameric Replication factor C (RF-C) [Kazachstania barnettii]CAD1782775.1 similar to Saccharomyces cerevisiae YJR068W RFC2 Subunit of heteropentameric Replication factor C (RF-C) [Kazachstania barnettii]